MIMNLSRKENTKRGDALKCVLKNDCLDFDLEIVSGMNESFYQKGFGSRQNNLVFGQKN